ncbi:MAG: hypothetical protein AAFO82_10825 [Bacteroidota bacterium]
MEIPRTCRAFKLEYWVVDPIHRTIFSYVLQEGKFVGIIPPLTDEDNLTSTIFDHLAINLSEDFPKE